MFKKFILTMLLMLTVSVCSVFAAVDKLKFNGFIADQANMFDKAAEKTMNTAFKDLQKRTGASVAVVVLNSSEGKNLDDLGNKIMEDYKIGDSDKGNGIIFLIAQKEQLLHVVLGRWFIGAVTSEQVGTLIQAEVVPHLQKGDFPAGLIRGGVLLADFAARYDQSEVVLNGSLPVFGEQQKSSSVWFWILMLLIPVLGGAGGWYVWSKNSDSQD